MAIKRWRRFFGLPVRRWAGRDPARRPLPEDCDVVLTPSALRAAGVKNVTRGRLKLERDSRFHYKVVIFPDGRRGKTTATNSYSWLVGVQRDEDRKRSLANLMVGDQALETTVTKPQGSWGPPFVPEIWPVPIAPPQPRPSAPLREARRRPGSRLEREADRAVAVARSDREIYSDLESHLCGEVLRILAAAEAPIGLADIAGALHFQLSGEEGRALVTALHHLKDEGAIVGVPGEGEGGGSSTTSSRHEIALLRRSHS